MISRLICNEAKHVKNLIDNFSKSKYFFNSVMKTSFLIKLDQGRQNETEKDICGKLLFNWQTASPSGMICAGSRAILDIDLFFTVRSH